MGMIEINGNRYETVDFYKNTVDAAWDYRKTCTVTLEMDYDLAKTLFVENMEWFLIVEDFKEVVTTDEEGNETTSLEPTEYYDELSAYSVVGDMTIHNNGLITITMGMPTAEELLAILLGE